MKTLLSITLLTFSLISSAQVGNYAPGGYYDQIEFKKKAEEDLAMKMHFKTIKAKLTNNILCCIKIDILNCNISILSHNYKI